jgi:hypothetical protein
MDDPRAAIEELTLMLMYLTSWEERHGELRRCWKGYDFEVLDKLEAAGLISSSHRAKSAYMTTEGVARAAHLLAARGYSVEYFAASADDMGSSCAVDRTLLWTESSQVLVRPE